MSIVSLVGLVSFMPFTDPKDRKYMLLGLKIAGDFGATIAVPIIIFVLVGQWLDEKYAKSPWFTVAGFVLAVLVSGRIIYKKAKEYGRQYQELNKNSNNTNSKF